MKKNKTRKLVTDKVKLKNKTEAVSEGEDVSELIELLKHNVDVHEGVGLSANQIGINKKVCVVNVMGKQPLVNPRIVKTDGMTPYVEGCLSFPGDTVKTKRHVRVVVEADNVNGQLHFGPEDDDFDLDDPYMLESAAVQHEIDHLNGKLMYDRGFKKGTTFKKDKEYGRNEMVTVRSKKNKQKEMVLKYKHAQKYLSSGWEIKEHE